MEPETTELTETEKAGELDEQKVFTNETLGSFTFRLPYIFDEMAVLRRRAQILGVPEENASKELLAISHAQSMYETYLIEAPRKFRLDKQRTWGPFLELMGEVQNWHQAFFQSLERPQA